VNLRLGRPVADPVGIGYECQLCGGHAQAYSADGGRTVDVWELCRACNATFAGLAQALADAQVARERRAEAVAQVAGQLELGPVCLCGHAEARHEDPADSLIVCRDCNCELFEDEAL
jgi:hypothetical protein